MAWMVETVGCERVANSSKTEYYCSSCDDEWKLWNVEIHAYYMCHEMKCAS